MKECHENRSVFVFRLPSIETFTSGLTMKLLIVSALCVLVVIASPLSDDKPKVQIPDGFGGMKFVNLEEEQEISPAFNVLLDTRFLLFTRFNPTIAQELRFSDINSVHASNFSPSRPTRILIHGWQR